MQGRAYISTLLVVALSLGPSAPTRADDLPSADVKQVPLYLEIEPAGLPPEALALPSATAPVKTVRGVALRIRGVAALELRGQELAITVTPPQRRVEHADPEPEPSCPDDPSAGGKWIGTVGLQQAEPPTRARVTVGDTGAFETRFTPTTLGEHEVVATDVSGRYRGEARFESEDPDLPERCAEVPAKEIEREAAQLSRNVCRAVELLRARTNDLPASPARDELRRRLDGLARELVEVVPCGEAPAWVAAADNVPALHRAAPATRPATRRLVQQLRSWLVAAESANRAAATGLAELDGGNVLCDQLDVIVNGLKFCSLYLDLLARPGAFLLDWGKENIPTKLVAMVPAVKRTPAVKEGIESAWKGVVTFKPTIKAGKPAMGVAGYERALGAHKMAFDLSTYAASRVFDAYCEQFQGPVSGSMAAELYSDGRLWWQYRIELRGELILRYPKGAGGGAIALSGEIMGNATRFKSWDRAIQVLFPKLAQGTVFKEVRMEPFDLSDVPRVLGKPLAGGKVGGVEVPDAITMILEKGGAIARSLMTPAFFRVPVRGELRGDTIRLELRPATQDFDDARVKVVQIMLPVLSLWPTVNEYALPYKGAHFILFRAMDDGPVQLDVERRGNVLIIQRDLRRDKRSGATAKGTYELSLRACNPGCP